MHALDFLFHAFLTPAHALLAVTELALSAALNLTPAEFDRRWRAGGPSALKHIGVSDPAGRQRAAAEALGELLQAADGVPCPLQPQYWQHGVNLVERSRALWAAGPAALRAGWASLQQLGLSGSQVVAVVQLRPSALAYNWDGEAKQRLLAWVQQELGLSPFEFLTRHTRAVTSCVATLAMRADFLRQHRPAVWEDLVSRGTGPLLSLLGETKPFCARAGCTKAELDAFNRAWLATAAALGRQAASGAAPHCRGYVALSTIQLFM